LEYYNANQDDLMKLKSGPSQIDFGRKYSDAALADPQKLNRRMNDIAMELNTVSDRINDFARTKESWISKDTFKNNMGDMIDEIEKKLNLLNETTKEQLRVINVNFIEIMKQKEDDFNKLAQTVRSLQTTVIGYNTRSHSSDQNVEMLVESEVKRQMNSKSKKIE
jgi:hypothetical protein